MGTVLLGRLTENFKSKPFKGRNGSAWKTTNYAIFCSSFVFELFSKENWFCDFNEKGRGVFTGTIIVGGEKHQRGLNYFSATFHFSQFGTNAKTDKFIEKKDKGKIEARHTRSRNGFQGIKLLVLRLENEKLLSFTDCTILVQLNIF